MLRAGCRPKHATAIKAAQGLAAAAATRQAAKRKREAEQPAGPAAKKPAPQLPSKAIVHEVQFPQGFVPDPAALPADRHGARMGACVRRTSACQPQRCVQSHALCRQL